MNKIYILNRRNDEVKMKKIDRHTSKPQKSDVEFLATENSTLLIFLLEKMSKMSRNNVKSLLRNHKVCVDGVVVSRHDCNLNTGQKVSITSNMNRKKDLNHGNGTTLEIIFEDNDIIIINKPAGLLSIAIENEKQNTAYHQLMTYVRDLNPHNRIFIVHRLDRDTSGLLVFAKNEKAKLEMQNNWAEVVINRGYVAVVEGQPHEESGTIKSWLHETKTHMMYSSKTPGDGLEAITNYKVIRRMKHYALLDIRLETGRKNQIRVHMKDLGHPIVGDKKYGSTISYKRLCLHAFLLEFIHPVTKETMRFENEIPKSFLSVAGKKGNQKSEK